MSPFSARTRLDSGLSSSSSITSSSSSSSSLAGVEDVREEVAHPAVADGQTVGLGVGLGPRVRVALAATKVSQLLGLVSGLTNSILTFQFERRSNSTKNVYSSVQYPFFLERGGEVAVVVGCRRLDRPPHMLNDIRK